MSTKATSNSIDRASRTQLDNLSNRTIQGSAGDSSYAPRDAETAAALEQQRIRDFLADSAPTSRVGGSVAAAQNRMEQTIHEFGRAFDLGA